MKTNNQSIVRKAFIATIPVMAGYLVLGLGFGIVLKTKGYGILWALIMSIFIYAGSMQYVAINLITGGASYLTIALTTLLVNARHLFYGISMIDRYKNTGKAKPYLIFALTDETYSLTCDKESEGNKKDDTKYFFCVSVFDHIYWITGSVLGAALGAVLPFDTTGIDFALTALFVTIVVGQWKSTDNHVPAVIGIVATIISRVLFGASNFLIPAMIMIAVSLMALRGRLERKNG